MQRLEVSGAVRPLQWSLGVKGSPPPKKKNLRTSRNCIWNSTHDLTRESNQFLSFHSTLLSNNVCLTVQPLSQFLKEPIWQRPVSAACGLRTLTSSKCWACRLLYLSDYGKIRGNVVIQSNQFDVTGQCWVYHVT